MGMSRRSLETLIDLVEIKLSCMEVIDREGARALANLCGCKDRNLRGAECVQRERLAREEWQRDLLQ